MVHDLDYTIWQESTSNQERRTTQKQLAGILGIELPEEDFEQIAEEGQGSSRRLKKPKRKPNSLW